MTISFLIPSRDRPCQLHLLLESIGRFFPRDLLGTTYIHYDASTPEFQRGYDKLQQQLLLPNLEWFNSPSQAERLNRYLDQATAPYLGILTDDSFFFRKVELSRRELDGLINERTVGFSFRLGLNTKVVYQVTGERQEKIDGALFYGPMKFLSWKWQTSTQHFHHPFALEGNIHPAEVFKNATRAISYETFINWECRVNDAYRRNPVRPDLAGFTHSVLVNVPVNHAGPSQSKVGELHPRTKEELNVAYLSNKVIDLDELCKTLVDCCQMEIPYVFTEKFSWLV